MKMKDRVTDSGVHIINGINGIGKACEVGDKVSINYTGYLENGDVFDSSVGKNPFDFFLGQNKVIKGWEDGILGLQSGSKCTLIIPPELGYGSRGQGPIPANSILLFDIEVTKVIRNVKERLEKHAKNKINREKI